MDIGMKSLIIIGAGSFGREVFAWAKQAQENNVDWQLKGFLDSRTTILDGYPYNVPILGDPATYIPEPHEVFVCAVGYPSLKQQYIQQLESRGATFARVTHRSVIVGEHVEIGRGVILCPNVVITSDVVVRDHVAININSSLGHDVFVDAFCQINANVSVNGNVRLGKRVLVGSNSTFLPCAVAEEDSVIKDGLK